MTVDIEDIITKTYEPLGIAILEIRKVNECNFLVDMIDANGPKTVLVSLLLAAQNVHT